MYSCLLPEFHLTGTLRRIPTGAPIAELFLNSELLSISESFLKSPIVEPSLDSELFPILIPQNLGKYLVHQAEPLCLARLHTTGRLPSIPEGAVKERLTHCYSSLRHSTDTIGLGIVFQGLLLQIHSVLCSRVTTHRMWLFTTQRRSWVERGYNPHLQPLENSQSPPWATTVIPW